MLLSSLAAWPCVPGCARGQVQLGFDFTIVGFIFGRTAERKGCLWNGFDIGRNAGINSVAEKVGSEQSTTGEEGTHLPRFTLTVLNNDASYL